MTNIATLAGGCFWCTEAIFKRLKGAKKVVPDYSGGNPGIPTHEQVSTRTTGRIEAIQFRFEPSIISYKDLLYVFFKIHDPIQKDGQGTDIGSQYMSKIYYHAEKQKEAAQLKSELQKDYKEPIVTKILPFKNFYEAENYHKDYYANNQNAPYCKLAIDPKIKKIEASFSNLL